MTLTKARGMKYNAGKWLLNVGVVLWFIGFGLVFFQKFLWFSAFAVTGLLSCYFVQDMITAAWVLSIWIEEIGKLLQKAQPTLDLE